MNPLNHIYKPGSGAAAVCMGHPGADEAPPFPMECFPPAMADMARAIAHTERTPETLAGCCILGIVSASIGAGLQVRSGPDRVTRGNLFLLASGDSGSGKGETFKHVARPLQEFERAAVDSWKIHTKPKVDTAKAILASRLKKLEKDAGRATDLIAREDLRGEMELAMAELVQAEADCHPPALTVDDTTTEKLAVMLQNNQEQLASISAEARNIVDNVLGRYSDGATDEVIYLKAYSGDSCRVDRMGREPVTLQRPCLCCLWLVQPDKVQALLAESGLTDGGLIPRFLICHTRAQPRPIVDGIQGIPSVIADAWGQLVRQLINAFRIASESVTIEPGPEAWQEMKGHFNRIVERRLGDLRDVGSYAARWNEQAWRIAVCLHAGLHGEDAGKRGLDVETARKAIAMADWFAGEQLAILAGGRHAARQNLLDQVMGLLVDKPQGIQASDVYRTRIVAFADEAHALLGRLEAEGELVGTDTKPKTGGHVTRIFTKTKK